MLCENYELRSVEMPEMDGIVMLVNEFPPLPVGGAETQAERLAAFLVERQWPVWVVTRHAKGLLRNEDRQGIQIIRPFTAGVGKLRTITFFLSAIPVLWRLRDNYKVLHAHLAYAPALVGVIVGRLLHRYAIVKLGGSGESGDINVSQNTLRGRIRLAAFRRWASVVITLSDMMRDEALSAGFDEKKIRSVPNGVDAQAYYPDRPKAEIKKELGFSDKLVVLFAGRLSPVKSLPTVIEALAGSLKTYPNMHLILVGEGSERLSLEKQALGLGIEAHVTFAGKQTNVKQYLNAADIFVLPSKSEGISNALLEAMSAGLACVSTSVGGGNEVLDGGRCGLLIQPGNVAAWTQALVELATDSERRQQLGEAARQRVLDHYDFSVVGSKYEELYAELINSNNKARRDA